MKNVGRRFGSTHALREVDLTIEEGESALIVGPNGSGKSTLLKIACGLLRPTSGSVMLWNSDPIESRGRVGYIAHEPRLYPYLSFEENLKFFARLYGVSASSVSELLVEVGLDDKKGKLTHAASRGELQRGAVARALINDPELLLADEPFTALDEQAASLLPGLLNKPGRTLLVASHDIERARTLSKTRLRLVRLDGGRVLSPESREGPT